MNKDKIKKALKCCDSHIPSACGDCPYCCIEECKDELITSALNLITEQEKEIELLKMQMKDVVNHADTFLVEEQKFEAENVKLKAEIEQLKAENEYRKKQYDNQVAENTLLHIEYGKSFERLKAQQREIDRLKAENERLAKVVSSKVYDFVNNIVDETTTHLDIEKQAKIDVLKELKTRHDYAIKNMGYPWDISQQIDELIKEIEK